MSENVYSLIAGEGLGEIVVLSLDRGASARLRSDASEREHQTLLAACRAHDLPKATCILEDHLRAASATLLAHLRLIFDHNGSPTWPS